MAKVDKVKLSTKILAAVTDNNSTNLDRALTDPLFEADLLTQTNAQGISPFRLAARSGTAHIIEMLMDYNAEATTDIQPFFLAASWGNTGALRVMINRGANVNVAGAGKQTPLIAAVKASRLQVVQELIIAGAHMNVEDSKTNTPLSIAWANNDLEMVRCLVKYGANVELNRWSTAPKSGANMCLHLVEGVTMRIDAEGRDCGIIPNLPASVLPDWIIGAPDGAAVLLDTILVKEVKSLAIPPRAELKGGKTMIAVSTPLLEFNKTLPIFQTLVPKDTGRGKQVKISILMVRGVLTGGIIQAITLCTQPAKILSATGVKAILTVLWDSHVERVYYVDLAFEVCNMVTIVFWTRFVEQGFQSSSYKASKQLSLALLLIVVVREAMQQVGSVSFSARMQKKPIFSISVLKCIELVSAVDIVMSTLLIITSGILDYSTHADYNFDNQPAYLSILSVVAFFRWLRIINYSCSFQSVGAKILPIVRSFSSIGAFLCVFLLVLFFLLHGTFVFYYADERFQSIFDFFMKQYFLGMVSRWPIFLRKLEPEGSYLHDRATARGDWVGQLDVENNRLFTFTKKCRNQLSNPPTTMFTEANFLESKFYWIIIFWYVVAAVLIGIVMLQIFVGVLSQAYANEKKRAHISFAQRRSEVSYTYFVNRTLQPNGWRIVNLFRVLIGRVKSPVKDGYVWICAQADSLAHSADDIVETSKKKEHTFEQMCKQITEFTGERTERIRILVSVIENIENVVDLVISRSDACARERSHAVERVSRVDATRRHSGLSRHMTEKVDDDENLAEMDTDEEPVITDFSIVQVMSEGRRLSLRKQNSQGLL
eukprot:GEMP01009249.1.p1 GENE.GEMP01009249.1~~GEMP01009249.1.p1  ORF type:complete len:826 (+),score=111.41 GEMP01009249.1:245-2722(+)